MYQRFCLFSKRSTLFHLHDQFLERDFRDKQKVIDGLKDTVDKQKRDLDSVRKEITEKDMLCSALRVSYLVNFS